jgi:serine/threonine protein kinase
MERLKPEDPSQLGDWRIMGRLGQGGGGTVFLAEKGAQKAAVKVLLQEFIDDELARQKFAIEAEVLKQLVDPCIGKIIDSDLHGKIAWIATEFINGPTLDVKVKYDGPLDELPWFRLASNLFHAITAAHELNIIHKDVKPSNIILGETGTKLIDFGIAHVSGRTRTMHYGDREGSTPFSSPEHVLPRSNPKMDVFSAAATLAYAGRGESIWPGQSELQLLRNINEDEPDLRGLHERQIRFLTPLLAKNPSERSSAREALGSANAFIEELIPLSENNENRISELNLHLSKHSEGFRNKLIASGISLALVVGIFLYANTSKRTETLVPKESTSSSSAGIKSSAPTPTSTVKNSPTRNMTSSPSAELSAKSTKPSVAKSTASELQACISFVEENEFSKAITPCTEASKNGNLDAMYNLGLTYNGTKDLSKARIIFENCSKRQDFRCTSELAYFKSREGKTDEAREMWNSAVAKGWGDAAVALGASYNIKKDFDSAIKWWIKAVELGKTDVELYISDAYANDLKDYDKALIWAKQMSKDKVAGADQRIGNIYNLQGKKDEAKQYLTKCGNSGNVSCMSMLGLIYFDEQDSPKAVIWAKRAASENFAPSYNLLTRIYMWLDYDLAQAKIWAQKSASTGDLEGIFTLGGLFALADNDMKASCLQYAQVVAKTNAMFKNNTDTPSTEEWLAKANEQYQKRDCKNVLA